MNGLDRVRVFTVSLLHKLRALILSKRKRSGWIGTGILLAGLAVALFDWWQRVEFAVTHRQGVSRLLAVIANAIFNPWVAWGATFVGAFILIFLAFRSERNVHGLSGNLETEVLPARPSQSTSLRSARTRDAITRQQEIVRDLEDQVHPPSLKEQLQRKLDEGVALLERVPDLVATFAVSLSGIPVATEAEIDNWAFQVEAILDDEPKRLAIFRIPMAFDALRAMARVGENPLRQRLDHLLHQLEEVIKGLP